MPLEPGAVEWKLYVRLFDEIDREFDGMAMPPTSFLHVVPGSDGKTLILQADPAAVP